MQQYARTIALIGEQSFRKLRRSTVVVFGLGGVGSYIVEALARAGVGNLALVDSDTVDETNINRQLGALQSTLSRFKTEVLAERVSDIDPTCRVVTHREWVNRENAGSFIPSPCSYIVDAIDTVSGKLAIIEAAVKKGIPVISAMGTGNRLDPTGFVLADIGETRGCPLARVMRRELKKRGINEGIKVVYSPQPPVKTALKTKDKKAVPASISFVPPVAGMYIAYQVIKNIMEEENTL